MPVFLSEVRQAALTAISARNSQSKYLVLGSHIAHHSYIIGSIVQDNPPTSLHDKRRCRLYWPITTEGSNAGCIWIGPLQTMRSLNSERVDDFGRVRFPLVVFNHSRKLCSVHTSSGETDESLVLHCFEWYMVCGWLVRPISNGRSSCFQFILPGCTPHSSQRSAEKGKISILKLMHIILLNVISHWCTHKCYDGLFDYLIFISAYVISLLVSVTGHRSCNCVYYPLTQ